MAKLTRVDPEMAKMNALPSPWITSAGSDLVLFVATPVLILPLILLSLRFAGPSQLDLYVAAFGALGHHLPGMMRAYGDRALFSRFKVRFTIAPAFLVAICLYFAFTEPTTTILLVYLWAVWHAAMQTHGFLRIYDAKRRSTAPLTAILDQAACLSWFAAAVLLSPTRVPYVLEGLYMAGVPKISLPEVQFNLGITLKSRGDLEGAVAANRKALSLDPMDPETRLKASIQLTTALIELAQSKIAAGSSRSAALAENRADWEAALDHVRRARDSFPADADVARFAEKVAAATSEARRSAPVP